MSKFQIILLAVFGVFIVVAVAVFSLYRGGSGSDNFSVTVWGDISLQDFNRFMTDSDLSQDRSLSLTYVQKSVATIETEFTEALARGTGPDLIILTQDKLWKERAKLAVIPYESISERDFKETFIEEGELFLSVEGIYALPLFVDPLVLYYNRDLLSAVGQAKPIEYWDEIYASAANLSKKDPAGNLVSSVMALGEARNIPNAKDILAMLMLQAGTPITRLVGTQLRSQMGLSFDFPTPPGESALNFYTQFSNPTRVYYSWNRSLIDAQTHFTSGDSAYYLGFASELDLIRNKNPNLNFGVSLVPQSRVSDKVITYGRLRGVAISRGTANINATFLALTKLVSKVPALALSDVLVLPPARRDLLSDKPADAFLSVFYDASLQSKGWLDPDTVRTDAIFREAIESVTSGRARTFEAIRNADDAIDALIN